MTEARQSDADWFREVLERYERPLVRYAARLTGDLERGRDVAQDTFLRLVRIGRGEVEDHLAEWLFTVCRNRALDVRRKELRMRPTEHIELAGARATAGSTSDDDPPAAAEVERTLLAALERLPERQRELVRLRFQNGLSYKQIAAVTHLSVSNVGFLLHTAMKALRGTLSADPCAAPAHGDAHAN